MTNELSLKDRVALAIYLADRSKVDLRRGTVLERMVRAFDEADEFMIARRLAGLGINDGSQLSHVERKQEDGTLVIERMPCVMPFKHHRWDPTMRQCTRCGCVPTGLHAKHAVQRARRQKRQILHVIQKQESA